MSMEFFQGANLVSGLDPRDNPLLDTGFMCLESFLADRDGGEPLDYIADAELVRAQLTAIAGTIEKGEFIALLSPDPMPDDHMFAGYHELKVLGFDNYDQPLVRRVYCDPEQYQQGEFLYSSRGNFCG